MSLASRARWALPHAKNLVRSVRLTTADRISLRRNYEFLLLSKLTPTVEVRSRGLRYFVSTSDLAVGRSVYIDGGFDEEIMARSLESVQDVIGVSIEGRAMLDIGANIGTSTLAALGRFGVSRVEAFEPDPSNYDLLLLNISANRYGDKVVAHQVALSNTVGSMEMALSPHNRGDRRLRTNVIARPPSLYRDETWETIEVEVTPLDSFEIDYADVAVVWMDVQGHEAHVLDGAKRLLASNVPIVTEYSPHLLDQAGGLHRFHDIVADSFRTVIDMRTMERFDAGNSVQRLGVRYPPSTTDFTDLLLVPSG